MVGLLGVAFARQSHPDPFDRAVDARVIAWWGGQRALALWFAYPGSVVPAGVLTAVTVVTCLVARRLNGAVLALLALPVAVGLVERVLKPLVHRTYLGNVVYPSGHTAAVCAMAATVTVLLAGSPARGRAATARRATLLQFAVLGAMWALACIVAVGVVALRWHYATDTLAGAAVGVGSVCGLALLLDLPTPRSWLDQATAGASRRSRHRTRVGG